MGIDPGKLAQKVWYQEPEATTAPLLIFCILCLKYHGVDQDNVERMEGVGLVTGSVPQA